VAYAFSNFYPATIYISTDAGGSWLATAAPDRNWQAVASSADGSKLAAVASGGEIVTLQTTLAPLLNITRSDTHILLSWTVPSTDFVLQENSDLTSTKWNDVTNKPTLNLSRLQDEVTVTPRTSGRFYRLKH